MKYKIKSLSESRTSCSFTFTGEGVRRTGSEIERYYSIYPYADDNAVNDNVLSFAIPTIQTYKADDELSYVPMVAAGTNLNLKFKAPSSVFRMYLSKFDPNELNSSIYVLKSVTITSETTALAGVAEVDMKKDVYEAVINTDAGVSSNSVMLDLVDGAELSSTKQSFFIALPKFSAPANDLTVTFEVEVDGKTFYVEKKISSAISFDAGRIKAVELALNVDEFTGSTEDGIGGDITEDENFTQNPDGSYSCDITEDMIIDEPLYLPEGTTATISLGEGKTLSNSSINANKSLVVIEDGAELTIDGSGAITSVAPATQALSATRAADDNTAFPIVVNGTLRIKGGDFTLNSFAASWLNCGIYIGPNGKLIVEDGTFRSPKGSFIFGHELGNRPEIIIHGGRFEGYDPSDNDFDGEGSNYLEPEYASYYVAENELVVASRTTNWEVDNSILLNSILKNGGKATLVDCVDGDAFFVEPGISVRHDVEVCVSGDPTKVTGTCNFYLDNAINCFANLTFTCDYNEGDLFGSDTLTPYERILYVDSLNDIANVYDGATLTLGDATYFAGTDGVFEKAFTLYGGNIVVNGGSYTLYNRFNADNMFVVGENYAANSSLLVNDGVFYGFDPERVTFDEEVKNCVVDGKGAVISFDGGHHTIEDRVGTFTAATYNVDGLPEKVLSFITLNGDGPGSAGTTTISEKVNATGWDFVAFQENFNYNTELQSKMTNYTFGTHRTFSILGALGTADTDGQNFATRNESCKFTSETMVEFVAKEGGLTEGANTSIKKGIRHYVVEFTSGLVIDVLTTHMNTADNDAQIAAQNAQLTEVANYINSIRSNNRPIIFMGDMNTRYTRNDHKTYFWDVLDSDLRCDDPWVEYQWNNYYPVLGSDSIMTGEYGMQKGEVVDKIICINNPDASVRISADTYLHDEAFGDVADHKPVVAKFSFYNM
ncbi:MAG: hypothetical protein IKL43_05805 [Alistipes sp.]|nr:hypothetical protein [Alistipes sp.]